MNSRLGAAIAGAFVLLMPLQAAHAQAKPASREQLRACMDSESELAARRMAFEARNGKNAEEVSAIQAEAAELVAEQDRLDKESLLGTGKLKRELFEEKAKAHTARVKAAQANAQVLQADLENLNNSLAAHNGKCGGISFTKEDREAVMKEREAAKK